MARSRLIILVIVVFILSSCHPHIRNAVIEKVTNKSIQGKWISVDNSIFLYAKFDLIRGGECKLALGPGKDMATFIITSIAINGPSIDLSMQATDDNIVARFKGKYDAYLDVIVLRNEDFGKDFLFVREKVFKKMISRLGIVDEENR